MLKYINIIIVILTCLSILNDNESKSNRNNLLFCQERQYEIDDVFFYMYEQYNQSDRFVGIVIPTEGIYFDSEGYLSNDSVSGFCVFLGVYSYRKGEVASGIYKSDNKTLDIDECYMLEKYSDVMLFTAGDLTIKYNENICFIHFEGVLVNGERVTVNWRGEPILYIR